MDPGDCRLRRRLIWILGGLCFGCGPEDRVKADLQLDVVGSNLVDTDWVRICVEGALVHETPVGDGRIAIPGIPPTGAIQASVHATGIEGSVGKTEPTSLSGNTPWATVEWSACSPICAPCTIEKTSESISEPNDRLLSIHFMD